MRWIRQKLGGFARLALFALAVHMALSFAHVHVDLALSPLAEASTIAAPDQPGPDQPGPDQSSPHPFRNSAAHDFCAICANIGMLGSLVLPAPSALLTQQQLSRVRFAILLDAVRLLQPRSFNQARGPPSA